MYHHTVDLQSGQSARGFFGLQDVPLLISKDGLEVCKTMISVTPVAGPAEQWAWEPLSR